MCSSPSIVTKFYVLPLHIALSSIYMASLQSLSTCMSHTCSCADMCRCTNQFWSCDHPKQMLPKFLSALVNFRSYYIIAYTWLQLFIFLNLHDGIKYNY